MNKLPHLTANVIIREERCPLGCLPRSDSSLLCNCSSLTSSRVTYWKRSRQRHLWPTYVWLKPVEIDAILQASNMAIPEYVAATNICRTMDFRTVKLAFRSICPCNTFRKTAYNPAYSQKEGMYASHMMSAMWGHGCQPTHTHTGICTVQSKYAAMTPARCVHLLMRSGNLRLY